MASALPSSRLYASLASAAIVVAMLVSGYLFIVSQLVEEAERAARISLEVANDDVVDIMGNTITPDIKGLFAVVADKSESSAWATLPSTAEYVELDRAIRSLVRGTQIARIKIYDLRGTTIYSPDTAQLGSDYSASEEFIHATRGQTESELYHRKTFQAFTGDLKDVVLVGSYHPLRTADGEMIGVAEVYSDHTDEFRRMHSNLRSEFLLLAGGLVLASLLILVALGYLALSKDPADR